MIGLIRRSWLKPVEVIWGGLAVVTAFSVSISTAYAGSAVVTHGHFTNVYVYPNSDTETWEQHIASLRPDAAQFSRAAIDGFTAALMNPAWPSYFDALMQYRAGWLPDGDGIHPPDFFGSSVATRACVQAALDDRHNDVLQFLTIKALANCHEPGLDPSPQVNLIFSPDIRIAGPGIHGTRTVGDELCTSTNRTNAWHFGFLDTPDFAVLPTSKACMNDFTDFTKAMSHEVVETISNPKAQGMGYFPFGIHELSDNCETQTPVNPDALTTVGGFLLERYWSNFDGNCQPRLDPPFGATAEPWVLGQGSPLVRFTGSVHTLDLPVPADRVTTDGPATQVQVVIQTGEDDLRGGGTPGENATVTLHFVGGFDITTPGVNGGRRWGNGETHTALLTLPSTAPSVSAITGVTISTQFRGGLSGDNWNVDKVALVVSFPSGSATKGGPPVTVHDWLDVSEGPLMRFKGKDPDKQDFHQDLDQALQLPDAGKAISALNLVISTGNDDLRAGSECDVKVVLAEDPSGATRPPITLTNVNGGHNWANWTL